jgi:hypothetical protein
MGFSEVSLQEIVIPNIGWKIAELGITFYIRGKDQ